MAKIFSQLERAQLENLTTAQEPALGATGRTWLNTDTGLVRVDDGTTIKDVGTASVPTGGLLDFAGSSAPVGWLLCDGTEVSRATFAALFSVVGTTYGIGDGGTTFNLPDLRGRVVAGKDDMGGVAANRITVAESGITGTTLGDAGGAESHALITAELASHTHTGTTPSGGAHAHSVPSSENSATFGSNGTAAEPNGGTGSTIPIASCGAHTHSFTTDSEGSGNTHQNTQPTLIMNKIIKT